MISGRGEGALLAWKLDSRGTIVDEVVERSNVGGGSLAVYQKIRGGDSKYTTIIAKQGMTNQIQSNGALTQC